ncbi:MAG: DUF4339 domain-containing protein [Chthoniobacteraceae bacterium]
MAFSEEYFIRVEGEQRGPYTFPQLKRLYDTNLIPEETLYWRDGMEQWEAVSDLCGKKRRSRLRHLKQLRVTGAVLAASVVLALAYCAPVLEQGWRELNDHDQTAEGAYWRARGYVRAGFKTQDVSVAFEPFNAGNVTMTGTEATVILPGKVFAKDGSGKSQAWRVVMMYDGTRKEWVLPAGG